MCSCIHIWFLTWSNIGCIHIGFAVQFTLSSQLVSHWSPLLNCHHIRVRAWIELAVAFAVTYQLSSHLTSHWHHPHDHLSSHVSSHHSQLRLDINFARTLSLTSALDSSLNSQWLQLGFALEFTLVPYLNLHLHPCFNLQLISICIQTEFKVKLTSVRYLNSHECVNLLYMRTRTCIHANFACKFIFEFAIAFTTELMSRSKPDAHFTCKSSVVEPHSNPQLTSPH
jgi:hypothetical protein